jgi:hypothetical protein
MIDGVKVCVSEIPGCSGSQSDGHVCAGNPPPDPPPPPATPPDPNDPDQPAPPPLSDGGDNCTGDGSCSPITINVYPPGGTGGGGGGGDPGGGDPGGGDPGGGNDDDDGSGQGGQLCPDGTHPVDGQCPAQHGTCQDGSQPVNGQCNGTVHHCSDGSTPVNGVCAGDGNCDNGQPPVNGSCGVTCPDGSAAVDGKCEAPWSPCQDGSQPVNGQCQAGQCNPQTDPNHCEQGHASGGGDCGAAPACNGDQIACSVLFQTWSTRCEVAKLNPEDGPEDSDYGPVHTGDEVVHDGSETDPSSALDASGFGYGAGGGACPALPVVEFLGESFDLADDIPCDPLRVLAALILLAGYVQAAYIIGRS